MGRLLRCFGILIILILFIQNNYGQEKEYQFGGLGGKKYRIKLKFEYFLTDINSTQETGGGLKYYENFSGGSTLDIKSLVKFKNLSSEDIRLIVRIHVLESNAQNSTILIPSGYTGVETISGEKTLEKVHHDEKQIKVGSKDDIEFKLKPNSKGEVEIKTSFSIIYGSQDNKKQSNPKHKIEKIEILTPDSKKNKNATRCNGIYNGLIDNFNNGNKGAKILLKDCNDYLSKCDNQSEKPKLIRKKCLKICKEEWQNTTDRVAQLTDNDAIRKQFENYKRDFVFEDNPHIEEAEDKIAELDSSIKNEETQNEDVGNPCSKFEAALKDKTKPKERYRVCKKWTVSKNLNCDLAAAEGNKIIAAQYIKIDTNSVEILEQFNKDFPENHLTSHVSEKIRQLKNEEQQKSKEREINKEERDWQIAKDENTKAAYKKFKRDHPTSNNTGEADRKIREITDADENAWKLVEAQLEGSMTCKDSINAYNEYLKNGKHHTEKKSKADGEVKRISGYCDNFFIKLSQDDTNYDKGLIVFDIYRGKKSNNDNPFEIRSLKRNGKNYIVEATEWIEKDNLHQLRIEVIEGGEFSVNLKDARNQIASYTISAKEPKFSIKKDQEKIIIIGGKKPFEFFSVGNRPIGDKKRERKIAISDLIEEGQEVEVLVYDANNNKTESIKIGEEKGSPLPWIILILTLGFVTFIGINRKELMKRFLGEDDGEEEFWQVVLESKQQKLYQMYIEKYPKGKHIGTAETAIAGFQRDENDWKKARRKNTVAFYKRYLDEHLLGMYRTQAKEAIQKLKSGGKAIATAENPKVASKTKKPSDIIIRSREEDKKKITIGGIRSAKERHSKDDDLGAFGDYWNFNLTEHWEDTVVTNVFMHYKCIAQLNFGIIKETDRYFMAEKTDLLPELGGFLLGKCKKHETKEEYVVTIDEFVSVTPESNGEYEIKFGAQAQKELAEAQDKFEDLMVVGWFHTHPGHGLFLSSKDIKICDDAFRAKHYLAMEIDTKTNEVGFFTRKKDGTLNNTHSDFLAEAKWYDWAKINHFKMTKMKRIG